MDPALVSTLVRTVRLGDLWLEATVVRAGADLVVVLTGGDRPHVGCVVIATAHAASRDPARTSVTSSVVAAPPHREEALARPLAERLAKAAGATCVVAAGVHTDDLTAEGVAAYLRLGDELALTLVQALFA